MKIMAVLTLYALFFADDRGQMGRLQKGLLAILLAVCLALAMGLEVPVLNDLEGMLKGG